MKKITIIGADAAIKSGPTLFPFGTADHVITGPESMSVSDGYHTFDELYDHRITLYIALCRLMASETTRDVWRSERHSDGEFCFGTGEWFVLGIDEIPGTQITYHLPMSRWEETNFALTLEKAPEFDGHSSQDVLKRIAQL